MSVRPAAFPLIIAGVLALAALFAVALVPSAVSGQGAQPLPPVAPCACAAQEQPQGILELAAGAVPLFWDTTSLAI